MPTQDLPGRTVWYPFASEARVGVARRDITPSLGIRTANWGAIGRNEIALGVHQPLTATALALSSESDEPVFIVSLDLGWWRHIRDDYSVRRPVLDALGIEERQLLLHLVHTHSGPSTSSADVDKPGGEFIPGYLTAVAEAVIDVCRSATATLTNGGTTWGIGKCNLATVRDLPCGATDIVGFNPEAEADDTVVVGRIHGSNGETIATVLNYACHPTTLAWQNALISPDYVGPARRVLEDAVGAPCLFLLGAAGELAPRDQYTGDTTVAERNGRVLGHAALSVLESLPAPGTSVRYRGVVESGAALAIWEQETCRAPQELSASVLRVPVAVQPIPTIEELQRRWTEIGETPAHERIERALLLRDGYVISEAVEHPVWIVQTGEAVIVAHPGEAYSLLQTELRRRHPDKCVIVMNVTNGPGYVYLPDKLAYERFRYQAWQTVLAPGALEAVLDAVDQELRNLPPVRRGGGQA